MSRSQAGTTSYSEADVNRLEQRGQPPAMALHSVLMLRPATKRVSRKGWITFDATHGGPNPVLTPSGRDAARSLVRGHRLWESFLHRDFDLPEDHLHEPAQLAEHYLGPGMQKELVRELNEPATDPHGQTIPGNPAEKRAIE